MPTKSAKRKSLKSLDNDWAAQLRRFAPSRFDKLSVMLYLHRFGEVVDIKPIFYCTTRSKNYNQLVINNIVGVIWLWLEKLNQPCNILAKVVHGIQQQIKQR